MTRQQLRTGLWAAVMAVTVCAAPAASAADTPAAGGQGGCEASGGLDYICGPVASEDLVHVPDSPWLIASGMNVGTPAHLYLIDSRNKRSSDLFPNPDEAIPAGKPTGAACGGPPDLARMSLDGLALRPGKEAPDTLYAANHGDRTAIEFFAIDRRAGVPRLRWIDCAMLPDRVLPNAVTTLPDGGLLVISFYDPTDLKAWDHMAHRELTGHILEWHPGKGFAEVPNSQTSGGNGLETSADGQTVYASAWSAQQIIVLPRDGTPRREIKLNFMPDNIHRLADGTLLVGGQRTTVEAVHACGPQCPQPWVVARVDPRTGTAEELLTGPGSREVNYACGAVALRGTVYVTVRGDRRIAWHHFTDKPYLR